MDPKQKKTTSKRVLTAICAFVLALTFVFILTACSAFTDAIKGLFSGESSTVKTEQGSTSETTPSTGETATGEEDSGEDPENPSVVVVDPPIEVDSTVVQISSSLTYDKASNSDLTLVATHENMSYYQILGMGLINDGPNARVRVVSTSVGSSIVQLDGEHLCTLDAGSHYFYYCVSDIKGVHYDPFRLTIVNSEAKPTAVKINYDVDCPNVYVTFHCDCGGAHTVAFDGSNYEASAGASRVRITKAVDKAASHNATVTCESGRSTSVTKTSPDAAAFSGGYLNYLYSYMGHKADGFIEDDGEASDLLEYLAYDGTVLSKTVYVSSAIHSAINANASEYLASVQAEISVPWSLHFGISYSSGNREVTFRVQDTTAGDVISSGYVDERAASNLAVVNHCVAQNVREKGSELAIDGKKSVGVRNVKELLLAVEKGYRPVAEEETLALYNKARDFCYTYLTDEMTDVEKLHVIYDYLAGNVSYDYSALNLFSLIAEIEEMSLSAAQDRISSDLEDASKGYSESMKAVITSARDTATSTSDLIGKLKDNYLQRLSAFSAEGVFNDGAAVCEGISYALMLLARIEGIECYQITGYATQSERVAHAWNKVHVNGNWYCIDATWGNIFFNDTKYVTHRYFMVDESILDADHEEMIGKLGAGVTTLAIGDVEYYKSVETATGKSLYIANNADLKAAVAYFLAGESNYIEVLIDPTYKPDSGDFILAFKEIKGRNCSITSTAEGRVFIAFFNEI